MPSENSREWRASRNLENLPARGFGIEFELSADISRREIADTMRRALRENGHTDRNVNVEGWGHHDQYNRAWIVKTDSSCGRHGEGGTEIASPVLSGWEGIDEVRVICEALTALHRERGVEPINKNCGVHVHVSADDLDGKGLRNLVQGMKKWEPVFYATQPHSRFKSGWAREVTADMARVKRCTSDRQMRDIWDSYPNTTGRGVRYHGLNLLPYWRQGSVEFRYFAGTLNFEKATFNILLSVLTVQAAKQAGQVRCNVRDLSFDQVWSKACDEGLGAFTRRFFRDFLQVKSNCSPAFKAMKAFARKRVKKFYATHFEGRRRAAAAA
jgi:hypothetical protein